jgi:Zn-dependent protease/CBS domain-containing protein
MRANIQLGRIWNIPIGINYSWFLIFALATWSLALGFLPFAVPGLPPGAYWLLGVVTSLLFFGSVLAHELGHAYLARRNGVPVRAITLFFFGGVAEITREPRTAGAEFRIAIAGPLVSVVLAALFGLLLLLSQGHPTITGPAMWLARINLVLAAFNMLPGFPLDGGRVFRAIVWRLTSSEMRATHLASIVGQVVAFGFIGVGAANALGGNLVNGLWLVFLGLFLNSAAASSRQQAQMQSALRGLTVGQIMSRNVLRVPSWVTVGDLLTPFTLSQGHRAFLVEDFGQVRGLLSLADIGRTPRAEWRMLKAEQLMTPRDKLVVVHPETDIQAAMQLMEEHKLPQLLVMDAARGEVLGVFSSEQILNYLRVQAELTARSGKINSESTA